MISSPIDEIKNRLDIVEVIQSYLRLQKAGANFRALCPFHSEKKPSFFVSPVRQIWHCFGCNSGGNIFSFVMQIEGVEFGDALRILAQKAGVELKRQDPKLKTERQRLYEIVELATRFFERQLIASKTGQIAKKYLLNREIVEESIKKWRIGYAPDTWKSLSDFLVAKGYKREEIIKAGLAIKKEENNFRVDPRRYPPRFAGEAGPRESASTSYDRFRGRIIFPIFDLNSQVIGFGGRIFSVDQRTNQRQSASKESKELKKGEEEVIVAKYVNTPSTLLYDKSRILYGLDKARLAIRKNNFCILVEGYIDTILSHQLDVENVVATSGTALTPYQLKILRRYSENLLTAFDMDIAGDSATKRGIDLAQGQGFNIKVITMPGKDPADVILENPKNWERLISEAKSILQFYFETTFSKFDKKTPEGKREISKILLPIIKRIPNKIEQSHWLKELAKNLEVKEEDVFVELKKISLSTFQKGEFGQIEPTKSGGGQKSRKEMLEERATALILKSPQILNLIDQKILSIFSPKMQEILLPLKENPNLDIGKKISPQSVEFLNYLFLKAEVEEEEVDLEKEIKICVQELRSLETKNKLNTLTQAIKKAEETKDLKKVNSLSEEFNKLAQELKGLQI